MILFRLGLLAFAWNWKLGSLVKELLVKRLITGKNRMPHVFERNFVVSNKGVGITTTIELRSKDRITQLYRSSDLAVITVPTSKYFQESHLLSWSNLQQHIPNLNQNRKIVITEHVK